MWGHFIHFYSPSRIIRNVLHDARVSRGTVLSSLLAELENFRRWLGKARAALTQFAEEGVDPVDLILREAARNGLNLCLIQSFHVVSFTYCYDSRWSLG